MNSERYSVFWGGVTQMVESTLSNDAQSGEAGQFAAWLSTKQIIWSRLYYRRRRIFFSASCTLKSTPTTLLLPLVFSSLVQTYAWTRGNQRSPTSIGWRGTRRIFQLKTGNIESDKKKSCSHLKHYLLRRRGHLYITWAFFHVFKPYTKYKKQKGVSIDRTPSPSAAYVKVLAGTREHFRDPFSTR
jgi:hypothetical protein